MCLCVLGPWVPGSCPHPCAWGSLPSLWPGLAVDPWAATLGHNGAGERCTVPGAWGRPCWANVAASRLGAGLGLCQELACLEKPSQALSPPHPG